MSQLLGGLIGNGYVGGAVHAFLRSKGYIVRVHDINPDRSTYAMGTVKECPLIFVCVPTPTGEQGQDLKHVYEAFRHLQGTSSIVVLKSTVLPGTCFKLASQFDLPNLVFSPEFLTARTADQDFASPTSIILGTEGPQPPTVGLFQELWPDVPILQMTWEEAELVKYARNTFYTTKVAWWNEMYALCQKLGVTFDRVKQGALAGGWINQMHCDVPGPDGMLGFGGACLPKDSEALVEFAFANGVQLSILEQALKSNKIHRLRDISSPTQQT